MKSVKVETTNLPGTSGAPKGMQVVWLEGDAYLNFEVQAEFVEHLSIVPGSTLICLAPGEELPEAEEGWETVGGNRDPYLSTVLVEWHSGVTGSVTLERGDRYRVQVKRAPKPKTASIWYAEGSKYPFRCGFCAQGHTEKAFKCANCGRTLVTND
jgi:hypothetical protein